MGDFEFLLVYPFFMIIVGYLSMILVAAVSRFSPLVAPSFSYICLSLDPPSRHSNHVRPSIVDPHILVSCIDLVQDHSFHWAWYAENGLHHSECGLNQNMLTLLAIINQLICFLIYLLATSDIRSALARSSCCLSCRNGSFRFLPRDGFGFGCHGGGEFLQHLYGNSVQNSVDRTSLFCFVFTNHDKVLLARLIGHKIGTLVSGLYDEICRIFVHTCDTQGPGLPVNIIRIKHGKSFFILSSFLGSKIMTWLLHLSGPQGTPYHYVLCDKTRQNIAPTSTQQNNLINCSCSFLAFFLEQYLVAC